MNIEEHGTVNNGRRQVPLTLRDLPRKQRVAETIKGSKASSWIEWSSYAIDRPYVSLNHPESGVVEYLMVDRDHDDHSLRPMVPPPIAISISRNSGRHHVVFRLADPVIVGPGARREPMQLLADAQWALTEVLDGDPAYTNGLTKGLWRNDLWDIRWNPSGRPVKLNEFVPLLKVMDKPARGTQRNREPRGYGRNVNLFDQVRFWCYDRHEKDIAAILDKAHSVNLTYPEPLPTNEIEATARSIAKFMATKFNPTIGKPINRGAMAAILDPNMTLKDRQIVAGVVSARKQAESMKAKVAECVAIMTAAGEKPSIRSVATKLGISPTTAQKHLASLRGCTNTVLSG